MAMIKLAGGVSLRRFDDTDALRESVYDSIKTTAQNLQPVSNNLYTLSLEDVDWLDDPDYTDEDVHKARLKQRSLTRKLGGTWVLYDSKTGKPLQKTKKVVANAPHFTRQGAVVDGGNAYFIRNQQRLKYGVYTRQKENGEFVTNVNAAEHQGPTHAYHYDPTNGKFNLEVGKGNIPMYTFLNAMGATDDELREAWGEKVFEANRNAAKDMNMKKLYDRFVRKQFHKPGDRDSDDIMKERVRQQAANIKFAREVNRSTLGDDREDYDKNTVLAATRKLIALSRGEAESDSRDNMAYQKFLGPEDLFAERLQHDDGRVRRQMLNKLTFLSRNKPDVTKIPSGLLTKQINSVITSSGLASPAEEITPFELYSKLFSVTRMGSGAINSDTAIPDSARQVQNSQFGFIDPIQTPESLRVGVDNYISSSAMKGSDGNLYVQVIDARTGRKVYKNPVDLASAVTTLQSEWNSGEKRIAGFDSDRQPRMGLKRDSVDYIFPNAQMAYNDLSNLVPMLGNVKGQRVAMAARMLTQALPLEGGEAPLVQSKVPDSDESYEERVGRRAAIVSNLGGTVKKVTDNAIILDTPEGVKKYPMLKVSPSNRKCIAGDTVIHITRSSGERWSGPVKDFEYEEGDLVLSLTADGSSAKWQPLTAFIKTSAADKRMLKVKTTSGKVAIITEDHSLVTRSSDGVLVPVYPEECVVGFTQVPIIQF